MAVNERIHIRKFYSKLWFAAEHTRLICKPCGFRKEVNTMAIKDEIELFADQYAGVGMANGHNEHAVRAILEPVLGGQSKKKLRTLQESLWARSQGSGDRYADLATALNTMIKKK